jgi:hypothetical protein
MKKVCIAASIAAAWHVLALDRGFSLATLLAFLKRHLQDLHDHITYL